MQFREGIRLALLQIRQERLKSAFSVLGVVIGVMFLVVVVSVVEGMDRYISEDFSEQVFGVNTIQVRRFPSVQITGDAAQWREWTRRPRPTMEEADRIRESLTVPARVGVSSSATRDLRTPAGRRAENVQVNAISQEMLAIRNLGIADGRPFSGQEVERGVQVAILGSAVAEALFEDESPLESQVRLGGQPFRVVGILEEQGALLGMSLDNLVLIPVTTRAGQIYTDRRGAVGQMVIQVLNPADLRTAQMDAEAALRVARQLRPGEANDFVLETAEESLEFWDRISTILFIALPGLVGISLVVGGIVIMNIMLVSVMERTREIGVRKALGAQRKDIISQFLVEAATLSGVGAVVGVGVGVGLTTLVRVATPLPAAVAPHWIALGVTLGVSVGIVAGVYPALSASRLDPVEALRRE
ncbi:MAG: ABC transporter permease [Gemmatimonadales bacterium]|nr:MAG: ABC transporter permease [Gemmatimonadales bacterium]